MKSLDTIKTSALMRKQSIIYAAEALAKEEPLCDFRNKNILEIIIGDHKCPLLM
jgi:hypothetical protein